MHLYTITSPRARDNNYNSTELILLSGRLDRQALVNLLATPSHVVSHLTAEQVAALREEGWDVDHLRKVEQRIKTIYTGGFSVYKPRTCFRELWNSYSISIEKTAFPQ